MASRRPAFAPPTGALLLLLPLLAGLLGGGFASKIDEEPELATEQVKQEAVLEVKYFRAKAKYGIEDRRTLDVFFELFDLWIMLYRLNKADAALRDIVPACLWRRDDLATKAIQALAFTRWKQGRYREALSLFHEMEGSMGKNAALCENIGHTCNALGEYDDAERYFRQALDHGRAQHEAAKPGSQGGVLLGLAGVQDRRGAYEEALPTAQKAYEIYKNMDQARGWESSLTAKAGMQVSKLLIKFGRLAEAEEHTKEAVRLFETTAGDDSPLVAGALQRLGVIHVMQKRLPEARKVLHRAYDLEAIKDAFDLVEIMAIHNQLVDTHLNGVAFDRASFRAYFGVVGKVVARVRKELPQDGNAGAYYKTAGELYVLGEDCVTGRPLLQEALRLFAGETSVDTSGLSQQCRDLIQFCDGTYASKGKSSSRRAGRRSAAGGEL